MLKKTLVIALIGLMVGGVAMGVISLADRSSTSATSGGRGQEQATAKRSVSQRKWPRKWGTS
ncbi:MAG: hypothetical protein ABIK79_08825 [Chloroflexota bacterium]